MNRKSFHRAALVALVLAVSLAGRLAAEDKTAPAAAPAPAAAGAPATAPAMTPEQQKMMDAMMKAGMPGPEHQWLASMAGSWMIAGSSWMEPGAPEAKFTGTAERTMILGGRVLMEKVVSEFDGMPFEGMGLTGYDNVTQSYWGSWSDNMGTGAMTSTGACKDGKCVYNSVVPDPMTGKLATGRMTSEGTKDHEIIVMWAKGPDGKEFKAMELHYTRKP